MVALPVLLTYHSLFFPYPFWRSAFSGYRYRDKPEVVDQSWSPSSFCFSEAMPTPRSLIITTTCTTTTTTTTAASKIFLPRFFSSASHHHQAAYKRLLLQDPSSPIVPRSRRKSRFLSKTTSANKNNNNIMSSTAEVPPQDPCQKQKSNQAAEEHERPAAEASAEPALPPLSDREFKLYNRLAEHMDYFVRSTPKIYIRVSCFLFPSKLFVSFHLTTY